MATTDNPEDNQPPNDGQHLPMMMQSINNRHGDNRQPRGWSAKWRATFATDNAKHKVESCYILLFELQKQCIKKVCCCETTPRLLEGINLEVAMTLRPWNDSKFVNTRLVNSFNGTCIFDKKSCAETLVMKWSWSMAWDSVGIGTQKESGHLYILYHDLMFVFVQVEKVSRGNERKY